MAEQATICIGPFTEPTTFKRFDWGHPHQQLWSHHHGQDSSTADEKAAH
jgi:hypothetical protein